MCQFVFGWKVGEEVFRLLVSLALQSDRFPALTVLSAPRQPALLKRKH